MRIIAITLIFFYQTVTANETLTVSAEEIVSPSISGKVSIGLVQTTGNVDKENLEYGLKLQADKGFHQLSLQAKGESAEKSDTKYQDSREASLLGIYGFNPISSVYGKITYYKNEFRGYKQQWRLGIGYLHDWYEVDDKQYFKTRIGYQMRLNHYTTDVEETQHYLLVGYRNSYLLMEHTHLATELNYEVESAHFDNYEINGIFSIIFTVNETIDVKLEYKVEHANIPVSEKEKTDTSLTWNLVYNF